MEGLNTTNSTEYYLEAQDSINILFITIKAAVSVLIILANALNLVVLPKLSDINEVSKIFHMALSITDLIVGIVIAVTIVYDFVDVTEKGGPLCVTMGIVIAAAPTVSVGILVILHLDRYLSITKPLRYPTWITPRIAQAEVVLVSVFLMGVVLLVIGVSPSSWGIIHSPGAMAVCMVDFSNYDFAPYGVALMLFGIELPALILVAMYLRIICISLRANGLLRRKVLPAAAAVTVNENQSRTRSAHEAQPGKRALVPRGSKIQLVSSALRSLKMPLIITSAFFLSWSPFSISVIYVLIAGIPYPSWLGTFGGTMICLNSFWNTVLYMLMKKSFRKKCLTIVTDFRYCHR